MNKNTTRGYIVLAVIFIVFSIIAFAAPFAKNSGFAVAYIFGVIAIAAQIYFFKSSFSNGKSVKSKFYGFPIARIGVIYLCLQLIISIVQMALSGRFPIWIILIINAIIIALAVIGLITTEITRDEVEWQDRNIKADVSIMRELQSMVLNMVSQCDNAEIKPLLDKLSDLFKYSDPVSSEATFEIESDIRSTLISLEDAIAGNDMDLAKQISVNARAMLMERNRICKLNK